MYEAKKSEYVNVPNNPLLTRIFFDKASVKVGKGLLSAIKEMEENPEKYKRIHGDTWATIPKYDSKIWTCK